MLMNALIPQEKEALLTFIDAAEISSWAQKAVVQAVQSGLIKGNEDGAFRPHDEITRAEMALILANASGKSTGEYGSSFGIRKNGGSEHDSFLHLIRTRQPSINSGLLFYVRPAWALSIGCKS
ncbi:S-layer homology domain-containing protein [Paenibacillus algorifonticola]|uniref:S-layer homology domain-containing protein n=2 Tax=Paenibacillus algorifonticola TaxID=684063 RepID=A0A1I1Y2M3_9BACL|nr:S-layer homology domain-containing protein [Paenibacillus algorifonticola]